MKPDKIMVQAGKGIIFSIKSPARIKVELKKPIDKPDTYDGPGDVPRSIRRKVLAVLNSFHDTDFIVKHLVSGKGRERDIFIAGQIMNARKKAGRAGDLKQLYALSDNNPKDFTIIVNSLLKAYTQLPGGSRFRKPG
jgi:hypothetical protein